MERWRYGGCLRYLPAAISHLCFAPNNAIGKPSMNRCQETLYIRECTVMKKKIRLPVVLAGLFTVGFVFSASMAVKTLWDARTEKQAFEKLAEMIATVPTENTHQENTGSMLPTKEADQQDAESTPPENQVETALSEEKQPSLYAPLAEQNADFFGWISIADTVINYPVMHTPDDPERYLHRDFDGGGSQSGVPFLAASCFEDCGNYLIYGHNMKNGTMFASLLSYANREYWREHPVIRFDTLTDTGEYQVLAAFYSQIYEREAGNVFRYYNYTDIQELAVFEEYVRQVQAAALYDTGVDVTYGDELLTLSTCSYHTGDGRFVVVARRRS